MTGGPDGAWRTTREAAKRSRVGQKQVYAAIKRGQLRAARIGGRRQIVIHVTWIDSWLKAMVGPVEVTPQIRQVK